MYDTQFELSPNVLSDPDFDTGSGWDIVSGEDIQFNGKLVCGGDGRNVVSQEIGGIEEGEYALLEAVVVSGGGILSCGSSGITLSTGHHAVITTMGADKMLYFDFEDSPCEVESVSLRRAMFAA